MIIEIFVALYNSYVWYFCYCGAGKLLPRVANHVTGCCQGGAPESLREEGTSELGRMYEIRVCGSFFKT
jgi:hypothetical protein